MAVNFCFGSTLYHNHKKWCNMAHRINGKTASSANTTKHSEIKWYVMKLMIWYDLIWYDLAGYNMMWCDVTRSDMIWYTIYDLWCMSYDLWYMIRDARYMINDMWYMIMIMVGYDKMVCYDIWYDTIPEWYEVGWSEAGSHACQTDWLTDFTSLQEIKNAWNHSL